MQPRILHDAGDEMRRLRDICDRQEILIQDLQRQLEAWEQKERDNRLSVPPTEPEAFPL